MVFYRFAAGIAFGIMVPVYAHENVYLTIATSFLRPHMKYRMEAAKRNKNAAIKTESLDGYLYDVMTSAAFFFLIIGPVCYRTYVQGLKIGEEAKPVEKEEV